MYSLNFFSFRNLLSLKNNSENVEELSLYFTVVNNDLGESQVIRVASFHIILYSPETPLPFPSPLPNLNTTLVYPIPSTHASEAIISLCFTGCGVKTRWSRYSRYQQQQNQLHTSYGRLQAEQVSPRSPSLLLVHYILLSKTVACFTPIFCYDGILLGLILATLRC